MQPGKPQGYGRVGEDRVPIFTLPGNPVSAYISFHVFVLPGAAQADGQDAVRRPDRHAPGSPARCRRRPDVGSTVAVRSVSTTRAPASPWSVVPGSHLVGDLASADCLIVVPEDVTSIEAGETVEVLMLEESR